MEYRLVKVTWKDIEGYEGAWMSMDDIEESSPVTIETLGWIVVEDESYITMVSSLSLDQSFGGSVTAIPRGCVESIVLVSELSECFDEKI